MIKVTSQLLSDAHAVRAGVHDALVILSVENTDGMPIEARLFVGSTPEDHILAAELADRMRRYNVVLASAEGIYPRTDHGAACLVLRKLQSLVVNGTTYK